MNSPATAWTVSCDPMEQFLLRDDALENVDNWLNNGIDEENITVLSSGTISEEVCTQRPVLTDFSDLSQPGNLSSRDVRFQHF